jgi:hypothetical protein
MVIFRTAEGKPGYHQAEGLDEAVRFVEHLRNQEQVPEARIFRMQEVPIEFKTYVRVELAAPAADEVHFPAAAPAAPVPDHPPVVAPAPTAVTPVVAGPSAEDLRPEKVNDVVVDPMPASEAAAAGRFGRFNRG